MHSSSLFNCIVYLIGIFAKQADADGMAAAGQAKQQKNPGAVVACIKQLDWMTGLGINSLSGSSTQRRR